MNTRPGACALDADSVLCLCCAPIACGVVSTTCQQAQGSPPC